ncbi:formate dehydrogenase subunit gamma [Thioalkalivibrio paradoxus]|uniref:Formate dehydrogenase n=1 Tax=Thioalkalivibrio paradoxus ARh 1 TaxID=713585 RepID=W0DK45_9GAMM|nr:formate dehydrogenase subunit gamma [Thioalkalivibrio paradoxus]AHE97255.1 formate dehydrogenase [Thioalkalivibrio paradoxus ARh 1]
MGSLALLAFLGMVFLIVALPLTGYLLVGETAAKAQPGAVNPLSETWRDARQGTAGVTAVIAPQANVLITDSGQNWRQLRNGPLATYGAWLMILALVALAALFLVRGRVQIDGGESGMTVERWTLFDRVLHWFTAILFILLAITGLSLLYGRAVLMPVIGQEAFASYAQAAIYVHNYLGLFFGVGLVLMVLKWIRVNVPKGHDLSWFLSGGGLLKGKHPHAGFVNAGEKLLFWTLAVAGLAIVITGVILLFPQLGQSRETMQVSLLIHAAASIVVITFIFGHIYLATVAMKGSMAGMVGGRVDVNWARQHHDLWLKELEEKGVKPQPAPAKAETKVEQEPRPAAS